MPKVPTGPPPEPMAPPAVPRLTDADLRAFLSAEVPTSAPDPAVADSNEDPDLVGIRLGPQPRADDEEE